MFSFFRKSSPAPAAWVGYRLRNWPELPSALRTADVLRSLSRMSLGPVSKSWFTAKTRLSSSAAAQLLEELVSQGAVEKIDLVPLHRGQQEYAK